MLAGIISHALVAILSALGGWLLKLLHIWWQEQQDAKKIGQDVGQAQSGDLANRLQGGGKVQDDFNQGAPPQ